MTRCVAVLMFAAFAAAPGAEEVSSTELVARLGALLEQQKLDAFAAEYPMEPGRFGAVLYFPGTQVLAITAPHRIPEHLRNSIAAGQYREVYMDLSGAPDRSNRLFVEDLGANGLKATREAQEPFDITWRDGTRRTNFDGNWKTQKLSRQEYEERFARAEREYAALLRVLIDALASRGQS